jgi:hypothetical protein
VRALQLYDNHSVEHYLYGHNDVDSNNDHDNGVNRDAGAV